MLGRKDHFKEIAEKVTSFVERERSYGHTLSKDDVYLEFKFQVEEELTRIVVRGKLSQPEEDDKSRLLMLRTRIEKLEANQKYRDNYKRELMFFAGCKFLKPQRLINLTEEEEEARCHVTWQEFDRCLWLAGCGDAADLAGEVLCPEELVEKRKEVILGFSDQVP